MAKQYETVIGLEVHVELATETKIFCGCSTKFGAAPNTHTCPVCTGMPGSLPVLNKKVVEYALALGMAANCEINRYCRFDRKNYFYPDNPQNYQISQLYLPICHDGHLEITTENGKKTIRIHEMHMEEDAGKLIHDEWDDCSLVDYNRSGVPLIEIVSEPDMRTAQEVIAYLEKLRMICQYLGISDCKLQEGSMRADVNLSVREVGSDRMGTRTEMKNLNSFKAITHAIEGERERQIELLEEGKEVIQETRRWDDNKESSHAMRSKEDAKDYRYFPDPDLQPMQIPTEWMDRLMRLSMLKKPSSHGIQKCWTVALVPLLLLYVWIFAVPVSSAEVTDLQQVTLMGKITDETGQKIVAASVFVPRKSFGTISDIDGNYRLSVGKKDTVYVSIAGYEKQKICVSDYAVENGKLMIDVLLQSLK